MKKKLGSILAAGIVAVAGTAGVAAINSGADAAGNIRDTHPADVQMWVNGETLCSGAYVGPQTVLTAAHCLEKPNDIYVVFDHLPDMYYQGKLDASTKGELVWKAPGAIDIALVRTPNRTVTNYARIAANRPAVGSTGQVCGLNKIDEPLTGKKSASAQDNYCGNITITSIGNYRYGFTNYGEIVYVTPPWGWPGDSGGPLYDTAGRIHGVLAFGWPDDPRDSRYDKAGYTASYPYISQLRANGAVIEGDAAPSTTPPSSTATIADGTYVITSALNNNKALDVNAESKWNGANVQLWDRNNGPAQRFKVTHLGGGQYSIVNVNSNKALDIKGASTDAGANALQWTWGNSANQKFTITKSAKGGYTIRAVHSNQVLDVNGSNTANGSNVTQWPDNGGSANQRWNFNRQ
ncbi:MAG: RICIN domain-containing protein [Actinomycetaceae bacterium]|nr:RICIN domain-containing protein [Actinomycetaceae bacterium]